ncbi:hypothetical protein K474DRAFT_1768220 [Panus rudis PR-1116 ss-1]|nr:hypothetical protein K474DRAFT_1768220 [Panus rudis PR-1116 ss-1]
MDPFSTSVPGSRHPVCVPVKPALGKPQSTTSSRSIPRDPLTSVSRRKPLKTFKSPSSTSVRNDVEMRTTTSRPSSSRTTSDTTTIQRPISIPQGKPPSLPLYHPKGLLALSLPELNPADFGISSPVSIDDQPVDDNDATPRSSARSRRPAAKVRDREDADEPSGSTAEGSNGRLAEKGGASPKKRRAGAGGGGGKRRRKDAEEADGTYPQPQRRTRNARNAATVPPSPLSAEAVAANDTLADGQNADSAEKQDDVPQEEPVKRSTRSRNANKRRTSNASEATSTSSASISIAALTKAERAEQSGHKAPSTEDVDMDKGGLPENEGANDAVQESPETKEQVALKEPAEEVTPTPEKQPADASLTQVDEQTPTKGPADKMDVDKPDPQEKSNSRPVQAAEKEQAVLTETKQPEGKAPSEEKEEGELSENGDAEKKL